MSVTEIVHNEAIREIVAFPDDFLEYIDKLTIQGFRGSTETISWSLDGDAIKYYATVELRHREGVSDFSLFAVVSWLELRGYSITSMSRAGEVVRVHCTATSGSINEAENPLAPEMSVEDDVTRTPVVEIPPSDPDAFVSALESATKQLETDTSGEETSISEPGPESGSTSDSSGENKDEENKNSD